MSGRHAVWFAAVLAALATAFWRLLVFNGFQNDHYVHLARAQQIVLGEWPVRDFVDPGMPFMYLVSSAAELIAGRDLWVEFAVVALGFAAGSAATLATAATLSRRLSVAVTLTALLILLNPRSYSYPKIALYALAGWLFTRAARSARGGAVVLALVTVAAFLFRHDHGLYIGAGAMALLACRRAGEGWTAALGRTSTFVAFVLVLLAPWALYVQFYEGLGHYVQSGVEFSRHEAAATRLEAWPAFAWRAEPRANASAWLFYLFHLMPLLALARAWGSAAGSAWRVTGIEAAVTGIAVMGICANAGFLRAELVPRIPDAGAIAALLGAYVLGQALDAWPGRAAPRALCRTAAAGTLAATVAAIAVVADLAGQVDNARLKGGIGAVAGRLDDLRVRLARPMPTDEQVPSRHAAAMMPFFGYLERCTRPDDRMLVTGLMPETFVLAHRGFAGGHIAFFSGYYAGAQDQRLAVERMRRQSIPVIVLSKGLDHLQSMMPIVGAFVADHYSKGGEIAVEQDRPLELYFRRDAPGRQDPHTGWPCA